MGKSTFYMGMFAALLGISPGCGDDEEKEVSATTTEQETQDNTDAETDTMVPTDTGMNTATDTNGDTETTVDTGSGNGTNTDHNTDTDTGMDTESETYEGECGLNMNISECDACIVAQCGAECVACQANPECEAIFDCMVHDCIEQGRADDMDCHYQCAGEHLAGYVEFEAFWRAAAEGCIALECKTQCPNHEM